VKIPYEKIPGFPQGAIVGHARVLEFAEHEACPVLVLRGRVHYYEGASLAEATFPVRVTRALGARWIALLNAAGGLNPVYEVGDIVLITDHINLMGTSPLIGPNDESLGPRFPSMSAAYDPSLLRRAEKAAASAAIVTRRGVYAALAGPQYETPAETRALRLLGADLVGMSTAPEAIVARHSQLKVLGLSVVTNLAFAGREDAGHDDVVKEARRAAANVEKILRGVLAGEKR
jgi:purine-nucleoside phosphorylase